jgi:hypothetical protein
MAREKRNLGVTEDTRKHAPPVETQGDAVLMPERALKTVLIESIDKLVADPTEATRYFSHFFDSTVSVAEREDFVRDFVRNPPSIVMGYPRTGATFPSVSIIMESEVETQQLVGQHMANPSDLDKLAQDTVGSLWENTYALWVMATHPDQALYIYHFVKSVVLSAQQSLMSMGVVEIGRLQAAEVAPSPDFQATTMYQRILRVPMTVPNTIPRLYPYDPNRFRVAGIFREGVVVDGVASGVTTYTPGEDENDGS